MQNSPDDEEDVTPHASARSVAAIKRVSTTERALMMKRSHSSPGEGRQGLSPGEVKQEMLPKSAEALEQKSDSSATKPAVVKRRSTVEKAVMTKRSHSSPGEGRLSLPAAVEGDEVEHGAISTAQRRPLSSGGGAKLEGTSPVTGGDAEDPVHKVDPVTKPPEDSVWTMRSAQGDHSEGGLVQTPARCERSPSPVPAAAKEESLRVKLVREAIWRPFILDVRHEWNSFLGEHRDQWNRIIAQRNRCLGALVIMSIYCGLGGLLFRFTEGAFEAFYKCGVKRVKRDFVDSLWLGSHHLIEDDWKSQARRKLMELETQLHAAHEAGVTTYSGQRSWSFLNAVLYCLTVVTTIGKARLLGAHSSNTQFCSGKGVRRFPGFAGLSF
jgi:hypothetical protein